VSNLKAAGTDEQRETLLTVPASWNGIEPVSPEYEELLTKQPNKAQTFSFGSNA
jgi:hypothetical protein